VWRHFSFNDLENCLRFDLNFLSIVCAKDREEVTAEVRAAQMQGYRNELRRQHQGRRATMFPEKGPLVREPEGGLVREPRMDRDRHKKRQFAGAGIDGGNLAALERCWILAEDSLFAHIPHLEKGL
jgi:hypothetical protein